MIRTIQLKYEDAETLKEMLRDETIDKYLGVEELRKPNSIGVYHIYTGRGDVSMCINGDSSLILAGNEHALKETERKIYDSIKKSRTQEQNAC